MLQCGSHKGILVTKKFRTKTGITPEIFYNFVDESGRYFVIHDISRRYFVILWRRDPNFPHFQNDKKRN